MNRSSRLIRIRAKGRHRHRRQRGDRARHCARFCRRRRPCRHRRPKSGSPAARPLRSKRDFGAPPLAVRADVGALGEGERPGRGGGRDALAASTFSSTTPLISLWSRCSMRVAEDAAQFLSTNLCGPMFCGQALARWVIAEQENRRDRQRQQHQRRTAGLRLRALFRDQGGAQQPDQIHGVRMGAEGRSRQWRRARPCQHRGRQSRFQRPAGSTTTP